MNEPGERAHGGRLSPSTANREEVNDGGRHGTGVEIDRATQSEALTYTIRSGCVRVAPTRRHSFWAIDTCQQPETTQE